MNEFHPEFLFVRDALTPHDGENVTAAVNIANADPRDRSVIDLNLGEVTLTLKWDGTYSLSPNL